MTRKSLVVLRKGQTGQPLFCFHPLPGTLVRFGPLIRNVDGRRPVYGLQARGLDPSLSPHRTLPEMASDYAAEIRSVQAAGPYAFYGYSMGGLVAYEVAQQLTAVGETISLLALGDCDAVIDLQALRDFVWPNLIRNILCLDEDPSDYLEMDSQERVGKLAGLAIAAPGRPFGSDLPAITRMLEIYDRNIDVVAGYEVKPYPGHVVLLRSGQYSPLGDTLGWRPYVSGLTVHRVPGTHHELMSSDNARAIAQILEGYLDRPQFAMTPRAPVSPAAN